MRHVERLLLSLLLLLICCFGVLNVEALIYEGGKLCQFFFFFALVLIGNLIIAGWVYVTRQYSKTCDHGG